MPDKLRILFVDDEPRILRGLRRSFDRMREVWDMAFASSGGEALDLLSEQPFDVVISDIRMPGMNGVDLLAEVRERYPNTMRLALSGQGVEDYAAKAAVAVHQYLPKPCDTETLARAVSRLAVLQGVVRTPKLQELLGGMERLPSLPRVYEALIREAGKPEGSIKEIGRLVSQDVAMSARILQLVNSAFFGVSRRITDPTQAVVALGMDTVKALALAATIFSPFEESRLESFAMERLWRHSMEVGLYCKRIAIAEGADSHLVDDSFLAGMLHDIGKVVLATTLPDDYSEVIKEAALGEKSQVELEREHLGASHASLGAYLLGLWGFSDPLIQAVAAHHGLGESRIVEVLPAAAVHVANCLANEPDPTSVDLSATSMDMSHLDFLGVADRLEEWRRECVSTEVEGIVQ